MEDKNVVEFLERFERIVRAKETGDDIAVSLLLAKELLIFLSKESTRELTEDEHATLSEVKRLVGDAEFQQRKIVWLREIQAKAELRRRQDEENK